MASVRSVQVKLVDMGSAQRVTKLGTIVDQTGHPEYAGRFIISDDEYFFHCLYRFNSEQCIHIYS